MSSHDLSLGGKMRTGANSTPSAYGLCTLSAWFDAHARRHPPLRLIFLQQPSLIATPKTHTSRYKCTASPPCAMPRGRRADGWHCQPSLRRCALPAPTQPRQDNHDQTTIRRLRPVSRVFSGEDPGVDLPKHRQRRVTRASRGRSLEVLRRTTTFRTGRTADHASRMTRI